MILSIRYGRGRGDGRAVAHEHGESPGAGSRSRQLPAALDASVARLRGIGDRPWEWLEHWAATTPEAVAISHPQTTWTYARYASEVRRWAARVASSGARSRVVGLFAPKRPELLAAIVGVMSSGNAVLVLDPAEEHARRASMLVETDPVVIYASVELGDTDGVRVEPFDFDEHSEHAQAIAVDDDDLASVVYSSGSTGEPEGRGGSHGLLVHSIARVVETMALTCHDVLSQFHDPSAPGATRAIFGALAAGAHVRLIDPRSESLSGLVATIAEQGLTVLHAPPQLVRALLSVCEPDDPRLATVRHVLLAADRTTPGDLRTALRCLPDGCAVVVNYSSTEIGTISENVFRRVDEVLPGRVPVGRPLPWVEVRIVDDDGAELPTGEAGMLEARVEGAMPQSFPARTSMDDRGFVRNGDMARLLADGSIDVIGRRSRRIKIDGFQVDLEEVESVLMADARVDVAVCVPSERNGRVELAVFAVAPTLLDVGDLHALCRSLPPRARPATVRLVDELPATTRGKIDRWSVGRLAVGDHSVNLWSHRG